MPIDIECPSCGKRLQVKDEMAGKRGKCPSCGQVIVVPTRRPAPQAKPAESSSTSLVEAVAGENASEIARFIRQQDFTLIEDRENSTDDATASLMVEVDDFTAIVAFTSMDHVETFAGAMPDLLDAEGGLPVFDVSGADLLANLPEDCGVLLNPETDECMVLPPSLVDEIKRVRPS